MKDDLVTYANKVPQLAHGGRSIQEDLIDAAYRVESGDCIIDLGSYLGSSVLFEAVGIGISKSDVKIYAYDRWKLDDGMNRKAKNHLGKFYKDGTDFKWAFLEKIKPVKHLVVPVQAHVLDISWEGGKIGLYVDDIGVGKMRVDHLMKTFSPYFIPGKTILFICDYYNYEKSPRTKEHSFYQSKFFNKNDKVFKFIKRVKGSITAMFLYLGCEIDYNVEGESYIGDKKRQGI